MPRGGHFLPRSDIFNGAPAALSSALARHGRRRACRRVHTLTVFWRTLLVALIFRRTHLPAPPPPPAPAPPTFHSATRNNTVAFVPQNGQADAAKGWLQINIIVSISMTNIITNRSSCSRSVIVIFYIYRLIKIDSQNINLILK